MSEWSFLKIDVWWKAVLVLGVLRTASSLIFPVDFINNKHLFGFGLGMIFIGVAQWMAWKTISEVYKGGILSTQIIKYNYVSFIILFIGIGLKCLVF